MGKGYNRSQDEMYHRERWFGWIERIANNELAQVNVGLVVLLAIFAMAMSIFVGFHGSLSIFGGGLLLLAALNLSALVMAWMIYSLT